MAKVKISELPSLSPATLDTTYVVGISGSTTYKISINQLTSSLDTTFATDLVTAALSSSLDGKLSTSSYSTDSASFNSRIISGSAAEGTISGSSQISDLGFVTGSYTTINSFNSLTQSFNSISQSFSVISGSVGTIDFSTLATTSSNTFKGNQIVSGSVGISANTGSWNFRTDGTLVLPNNTGIYGNGLLQIDTIGGFLLTSYTDQVGGGSQEWYFHSDGILNVPGNIEGADNLLTTSSFNTFTQSYYSASASFDERIIAATNEQDLSYLATTGSNQFNGNQTITGSLNVTNGITGSINYNNLTNIPTLVSGSSQIFTGYDYEIHVSQIDGNDTTGNGDLLTPVASITKALTLITGQRRTIVIHPGSYTESPSITNQYTVLTTFEPLGGNTAIVGTVSTSVGCTIAGLTIQNLTITTGTGVGVPNIINCNISGTLTKSGNAAFTDIHNCNIDTACNITGTGLVTINDGNPNFVTVNNAGANVIIKNAMSCVAPSVSAGTLNITDSIVIAAVTNAVTSNASSIITLANSQFLTSALNAVAPVSLSGFYSIFNCVFDKPNSTLVGASGTGGSTNSVDYFQYINADKFITQGGTSNQFVKGDGSLDSVVPATTGSNTFIGNQTITGSLNISGGLDIKNNGYSWSFGLDGTLTAPVGANIIRVGNLVTTSSFNTFTQSIDSRVDSLENATSSYLTSLNGAISASTQVLNGSSIFSSSAQLPNGLISSSTQLPSNLISGSAQISTLGFISSSNVASIQTITSASYAALTPVSGTLYIIIG